MQRAGSSRCTLEFDGTQTDWEQTMRLAGETALSSGVTLPVDGGWLAYGYQTI